MAKLDKATIIADFDLHVYSGKAKFFQQDGLDFVPGEAEGNASLTGGSTIKKK